MPLTVTSDFSGDHIGRLITRVMQGLDAIDKNIFRVEADIKKKRAITNASLDAGPQEDSADPPFVGDLDLKDRSIELEKYIIVNMKLDPAKYEDHWLAEKMSRGEPYVEWTIEQQMFVAALAADNHRRWANEMVWTGDKTDSAPKNVFNGIITRALLDADVIEVPSWAPLTLSNILAKMDSVFTATPEDVLSHPSYRFKMRPATWRMYAQADRSLPNKGLNNYDPDVPFYRGIPIVPCHGFPADTILGCIDGPSLDSNLFMGVGYDMDSLDTLRVGPVTNTSREWFFQMRGKLDVNYAKPAEMVLYADFTP